MSGGVAPAAALLWLCLGNVSPLCPCKGGGEEGFPPQKKPHETKQKTFLLRAVCWRMCPPTAAPPSACTAGAGGAVGFLSTQNMRSPRGKQQALK